VLDEQRLGGIEDGAARVLAVLVAAPLGGGFGGAGGIHGALERRERVVTMLQKHRPPGEGA
jgi:hypothetical protein